MNTSPPQPFDAAFDVAFDRALVLARHPDVTWRVEGYRMLADLMDAHSTEHSASQRDAVEKVANESLNLVANAKPQDMISPSSHAEIAAKLIKALRYTRTE